MRKIALIIILIVFAVNTKSQNQTVNYVADTSVITNPERGIMSFISSYSTQYYPVSAAFLQKEKKENISILYLGFYLDSFITSKISNSFLTKIQNDLNTIRNEGFKVILRFVYSSTLPSSPPYKDGPAKAQLLEHIQQLKPILIANKDIIMLLQSGFVGTWGEEAYSDVFGIPPSLSAQQKADRKQIYDSLLAALPSDRFVSSRTPYLKSALFGYKILADTITLATAYNGSDKSRIALHNDCFLSNFADAGTFGNNYSDTAIYKPYSAAESKYTPMGGETCGYNASFGQCPNSLKEMRRFHWTYLNKYWNPDNFTNWAKQGCTNTIRKSLGYRLELITGNYPTVATTNTNLVYNIQIKNVGFAAPINPRKVELILKNNSSGNIYKLALTNTNPRYWFADASYTINEPILIPNTIPSGNYHLYLNLPDPEPSLINKPTYSIRLANKNTWDSITAYNDLLHDITITNAVGLNDFSQNNVLKIYPNPSNSLITITLNNKTEKQNVQIYSAVGQLIKEVEVNKTTEIDISELRTGVYFVKLKNSPYQQKFFKIN